MNETPTNINPTAPENNPAPIPQPDPLTDRWPALHTAMQDYKREVAKDFTALAYRCVTSGIIRFDDRRRLAKAAHRAGIRPFDAQLLIACAIRQHALDQGKPRRPAIRPILRKPKRLQLSWKRFALLATAAALLDALLLYNWLS